MYKKALIFPIFFIFIVLYSNISIIEKILKEPEMNINLINKIDNVFLQSSFKSYYADYFIKKGNEKILKSIFVPYDSLLEKNALKMVNNPQYKNLVYILKDEGYQIFLVDELYKKRDWEKMIKYFPNAMQTKKCILENLAIIDKEEVKIFACEILESDFNESMYALTNDSAYMFFNGIINEDEFIINKLMKKCEYLLQYVKDKNKMIFVGAYIDDNIEFVKPAYYRGRYYEKEEKFDKALKMYLKANDPEAYIRIIAKIGEYYSRSKSDSILLNDESIFESVLYHKAKSLYFNGKQQMADSLFLYLSDLNSISFYCVRARQIINKISIINKKYKLKEFDKYKEIFLKLREYDKESIFNNFADKTYRANKDLAKYFAEFYYRIEVYNRTMTFGYRMLYNGVLIDECSKYLFPLPHSKIFEEAAKNTGVDIALLYAIARQESWFNPNAVSSAGAKGIMQLMDFVYEEHFDDNDNFNIEKNITVGSRHISTYLSMFELNLAYGIMSYNAGPGNVVKWDRKKIDWELYIEMIPFRETRIFIKNVLRDYYFYKFILNES